MIIDDRVRARFWAKVDKNGPVPLHVPELGNCWTWLAGKCKGGYGKFCIGPKGACVTYRAHRVSIVISGRPIPDGSQGLHHCDNPGCVRPEHLFVGTNQDNRDDCKKKARTPTGDRSGPRKKPGSYPRGEKSWASMHPELMPRGDDHYSRKDPSKVRRGESVYCSKLDSEKVLEIRRRHANGDLLREIASFAGVSVGVVWLVAKRKAWKHVPEATVEMRSDISG